MQANALTTAGSSCCASSLLLVGPGSQNEDVVQLQKPGPGVTGMSPVDQEVARKALKISLDELKTLR